MNINQISTRRRSFALSHSLFISRSARNKERHERRRDVERPRRFLELITTPLGVARVDLSSALARLLSSFYYEHGDRRGPFLLARG